MSLEDLNDFAGVDVPHLRCVVKVGCDDLFPIGTERSGGRTNLALEYLDNFTSGGVPQLRHFAMTGGDDLLTVGAEGG